MRACVVADRAEADREELVARRQPNSLTEVLNLLLWAQVMVEYDEVFPRGEAALVVYGEATHHMHQQHVQL